MPPAPAGRTAAQMAAQSFALGISWRWLLAKYIIEMRVHQCGDVDRCEALEQPAPDNRENNRRDEQLRELQQPVVFQFTFRNRALEQAAHGCQRALDDVFVIEL